LPQGLSGISSAAMLSTTRLPLALALAGLALTLTACSDGDDPAPVETTAAAAAEIAVGNARLVLPAVSGNPAAVYFDLANNTDTVAVLTGIEVPQAQQTELHETTGSSMVPLAQIAIQPGEQVLFAPGGKHAMVFGPPAVEAGTTLTMTFRFEDGRSATAEAMVQPAGGASPHAADHSGAAH
jgi:periplasmic copper chaperone A